MNPIPVFGTHEARVPSVGDFLVFDDKASLWRFESNYTYSFALSQVEWRDRAPRPIKITIRSTLDDLVIVPAAHAHDCFRAVEGARVYRSGPFYADAEASPVTDAWEEPKAEPKPSMADWLALYAPNPEAALVGLVAEIGRACDQHALERLKGLESSAVARELVERYTAPLDLGVTPARLYEAVKRYARDHRPNRYNEALQRRLLWDVSRVLRRDPVRCWVTVEPSELGGVMITAADARGDCVGLRVVIDYRGICVERLKTDQWFLEQRQIESADDLEREWRWLTEAWCA